MYRCRIGCFNSSFKAHHSKGSTLSDTEIVPRKKILLLMMLIILFSCTVAALQAYSNEALHTLHSPTYPNQPSPTTLWRSEELKPWPPPYSPLQYHINPGEFKTLLLTSFCGYPPSTPCVTTRHPSSPIQWPVPVASCSSGQ